MLETEEKTQYLLSYINEHGKITNFDMYVIQEKTKMSTAQQMSLLKKLSKNNKIQDLSQNWNEPMFRKRDPKNETVDKMIDREIIRKSQNIEEKILRYIQTREGQMVEYNLFLDFGISIEKQKKEILKLIEDERIELFQKGYRIKKSV